MHWDVEVQQGEIDGVPALWLETARPFTASLMFRVGLFDERLRIRGMTHLVEHLTLSGLQDHDVEFNGYVAPHETAFLASGDPQEVGRFLAAVCRSLHDLPVERFDVERAVLRREAELRGGFFWPAAMCARYFGLQGPGLFNYGEPGLRWIGPDEVRPWVEKYFARSNAIVTLTGQPQDGWELPLPPGSPLPPPEFDRAATPPPDEPTLLASQDAGVSWGALMHMPRGLPQPAVLTALQILKRRLQDRLRHDLGKVYTTGQTYWRIDQDLVFVALGVESVPEDSREVGVEFLATLRSFIDSGPTADEVHRERRTYERQLEEYPDQTLRSHLYDEAIGQLCRWERYGSPRRIMEGIESMDLDQMRLRFAEAFRQSFMVADLPEGTLSAPKFPPDRSLDGRDFRRKPSKTDPIRKVRIGPDGLVLHEAKQDEPRSLLRDDIELVAFEGESIAVYSAFGSAFIDTSAFFAGRRMADMVRAMLAPDQILPPDRDPTA